MPATPPILAGEIGLISLFDLGQLLLLNRGTGTLAVTDGDRRGQLVFREGQLVDAIDETRQQGAEAAYRLFAWKRGRFEFHSGKPPGPGSIDGATEGIMLEAARRMDEAADASGGGGSKGL